MISNGCDFEHRSSSFSTVFFEGKFENFELRVLAGSASFTDESSYSFNICVKALMITVSLYQKRFEDIKVYKLTGDSEYQKFINIIDNSSFNKTETTKCLLFEYFAFISKYSKEDPILVMMQLLDSMYRAGVDAGERSVQSRMRDLLGFV